MKYSKDNCNLILSMNNLNVFTTLYIFYKQGLLVALPHSAVCLTSFLFWNNIQNMTLLYIDYLAIFNSLIFTYVQSILNNKDYYITPLLYLVFYTYFFSIYFKNIKKENLCVYSHTLTYLIGNVGTILTFA